MTETAPPRIALRHCIHSRFDRPVALSTHWLRLRPAPHTRGRLTAFSLRVEPALHFLNWVRDPFENHLARLDLPEPVTHMVVEVEIIAELAAVNPFDFLLDADAVRHPFRYPPQLARELAPYLSPVACGDATGRWVSHLERGPVATLDRLEQVNRAVNQQFRVHDDPDPLPGPVDLEQVVGTGAGSSWELAWLLTVALRSLGLAARFCSGYRVILVESGPDHAEHCAWSEVYLPGAGWVGLDPAAGVFTGECHVPLATAPEPSRVGPLLGYREACEEQCSSSVDVQRLVPESPDSPATGGAWRRVMVAAARTVDDSLREQGLELAQGVRLAFCRDNARDRPEWSTAAPGADKWRAALALGRSLRDALLPGGVLQLGQGEWYGGEALPRWQLRCIARKDGVPMWSNAERQDGPAGEAPPDTDAARDVVVAGFARRLSATLGLGEECWIAARDDVLHRAWAEAPQELPRPSAEVLRDPKARRRLSRELSATDRTVGYVLPLAWDHGSDCWRTAPWPTRRGQLTLLPGDSAIGYRLPLNELPVGQAGLREQEPPAPFWREPPALPMPQPAVAAGGAPATPGTALCLEHRDGILFVFLPPCPSAERYQALVAAAERAAADAPLPVLLEGYLPPPDPRLRTVQLEPEVGTLEVTLPASSTWDAVDRTVHTTCNRATELGLTTAIKEEDGSLRPLDRRAAWTLSGPTPGASPWLCRPSLLRSLLRYWQRHPSLSFLFAGGRVGPDSWAPRVDEGREDMLYELDVALERVPDGEVDTPWLIDRLLSHLVADPAGHPARAELRLDRLYPPGDDGARCGEVVVQAFAPPLDARLAGLQALLLRAVVAHVARRPEHASFIRWGTALHDRFMLPRVLRDDFRSVLEELRHGGHGLAEAWFQPYLDDMFPPLEAVRHGSLRLLLRPALEPWPVMAEEISGGGMARFIDPAMVRVEVELRGFTPGRHVVVCNGRRVPLQPAGVPGEAVAGVRCKVLNPPATLYPTVPPEDSLVFEVLDAWSGERLGGCTYYPPRPAGVAAAETGAGPRSPWDAASGPPAERASAAPTMPTAGVSGYVEPLADVPPGTAPIAVVDPDFPYLLDLSALR